MHNCNNRICELLNPILNQSQLLKYKEVMYIITKVEEMYFNRIRTDCESLMREFKEFLVFDFLTWCRQHIVYQLPNIEFVQEIAKKIDEIDPKVILEVGAGQGIISKHVSKYLNREIILTDDYSWWKACEKDEIERYECPGVIKMDYITALKTYNPDLVIASWIPYKRYWTNDFRECTSVKGYILIGEGPGGCTGSELDWITSWITSWIRHDLEDVERFGISRTDHSLNNAYSMRHTRVTYFER